MAHFKNLHLISCFLGAFSLLGTGAHSFSGPYQPQQPIRYDPAINSPIPIMMPMPVTSPHAYTSSVIMPQIPMSQAAIPHAAIPMAGMGQSFAYGGQYPYGMQPKKPGLWQKLRKQTPQARPRVVMPQFQRWVNYEPQYKLYPGDQIDIVVSSAPELSRTLTVGPDGRIVMPMARPIMAAGRSYTQIQHALMAELGKQLRDPRIAVTPRAYGPQQIFVGGEVTTQGTYTMPGPMGVLEAIFMAGGLRDSARTTRVAVLRRAPNGGMMMRPVNIGQGLKSINQYDDVVQLRRGDIIFVPKNNLAEIGVWVQNFRNALPFDFNLTYQFGDAGQGLTTVVQ